MSACLMKKDTLSFFINPGTAGIDVFWPVKTGCQLRRLSEW